MTFRSNLFAALLALLVCLTLAACGGQPATLAAIPAYPGATELKPGVGTVGDTLAQNNQQDAALRSQLDVGGKTEQKGFRLPEDTGWEQVKSFYDERLKADGWSTNSLVSGIMEQANQGNGLFQTANWQKGKQNLTIVLVASPTGADKELIISLSTP